MPLKLTINQDLLFSEPEIIINCTYLDEKLNELANYIRQYIFSLEGNIDGKVYQVPLESIFYMESVDGKTFFYDKNHAYFHKKTLSTLENLLKATAFVRISKSCLVNTMQIRCAEPYVNHRIKIELKNGEHLVVSRNYIEKLKEKLRH